jgi:hypothetical protein
LGKIIVIPKPNKDASDPQNYRPISLLPNFGKILEKLILKRLTLFEEANEILSLNQFGFRGQHSTTHQLMRVVEKIKFGFNVNKSFGLVQLDIERAFDTVWHNALLHKLLHFNFPIFLIKIVKSFLSERKAYVSLNKSKSNIYSIVAGVPQGSILSPFLFNIYLNDLPKISNCHVSLYADDINFMTAGTSRELSVIISNLEEGFSRLHNYYTDWKLKLNINKTKVALFTHSRIMRSEKNSNKLNLLGTEFPWLDFTEILGVGLDSKLLFGRTLDLNIKKAKKSMVFLYPLLKKYSHVPVHSKLVLYKQYIRSILTYSCSIWCNSASTHLNKLQTFQNKCLRMVLSLPYSTKISKLHSKADILYINEYINKLTDKFYVRSQLSNNCLIRKFGNYTTSSVPFRIKHRLPKKL